MCAGSSPVVCCASASSRAQPRDDAVVSPLRPDLHAFQAIHNASIPPGATRRGLPTRRDRGNPRKEEALLLEEDSSSELQLTFMMKDDCHAIVVSFFPARLTR